MRVGRKLKRLRVERGCDAKKAHLPGRLQHYVGAVGFLCDGNYTSEIMNLQYGVIVHERSPNDGAGTQDNKLRLAKLTDV